MDESKKLNAGKYKNKQRYKNKSKIVSKDSTLKNTDGKAEEDKIIIDDGSRLFERRGLESNWYRYESKLEEEEENDKDSSRDFSLLASAPISQGSYFHFKSDKNITDIQEIKQIDSKLFHLDVNLLNLSIATIPFHEQCGIEEKYFSESQLHRMIKDGQENILQYNIYLQSKKETTKKYGDKTADLKESSQSSGNVTENVNIKDKIQSTSNFKNTNTEDLEQWLEDILKT